ncbi:MAG: ubiquinone/menaquinone biosynthesis methyltransferase [Gemmatimonas sp.]
MLKDRTNRKPVPPSGGPAEFRLGALDVNAYLRDPARKQEFVTPMFDIIAPRYDEFTRVFSFGMDGGWKREALAAAIEAVRPRAHALSRSRGSMQILDLACGTGDLAFALAIALPESYVTGIDASPRMIEKAGERLEREGTNTAWRERIQMRVGDMSALQAGDASVDLVTAGYGVRNVPDAAHAVREMARVLRPGGTLATLDFYRPRNAVWRTLLLQYLSVAGNLVGWWWHRDPVVYGYIARSIDHFMSWQSFSALLEREGFAVQRVVRHLGGGIALHIATRR